MKKWMVLVSIVVCGVCYADLDEYLNKHIRRNPEDRLEEVNRHVREMGEQMDQDRIADEVKLLRMQQQASEDRRRYDLS